MKRLIRQILAAAIWYSGLLWLYRKVKPRRFPAILMYHRVVESIAVEKTFTQPGISVLVKTFDQQIALLKSQYPVLRLDDYAQRVKKGQAVPANAVIITFDDGWRDNYLHAWEILKRHEVPATIFLVTDNIGDHGLFWFVRIGMLLLRNAPNPDDLLRIYYDVRNRQGLPEDRDAHKFRYSADPLWFIELCKRLDRDGIEDVIARVIDLTGDRPENWPRVEFMLRWEDIRAMSGPLIEFGSHGCSHTIFTTLAPEELAHELNESRKIIEREITQPVLTCAYPNGNHNETIRKAAMEARYLCAAAVRDEYGKNHPDDLFSLQRQNVHEGKAMGFAGRFSRALFLCQVEGIL